MSDQLGSLCIVLHGHLPYVLHHGALPHGEAWLFEAASETYLPLLDTIGGIALNHARPALTVGLTPVLLEQLAHDRFRLGFVAYLNERIERARSDRREFESRRDSHFAGLARRWEQWYEAKLEHFQRIGGDIPAEFSKRRAEGHIQLLTSAATHAYLPLLLNDAMIRAQVACGTAITKKRLGVDCRGMWLPECGYRPQCDQWKPAVLFDDPRPRPGLERFIAAAGVNHFFVDSHLVQRGEPLGILEHGQFRTVVEAQIHWDRKRGWRDPLEPVGVASDARSPACFAFARHPHVSEQVWSASFGYPGAGEYLEFHRKRDARGLRYHRITDIKLGLGDKQPYAPDEVPSRIYEQARHFCDIVREALRAHKSATGRPGVCVAPFDAELFGHWWHEGPQFLRDVILTLNHDPQINLITAEEAMERHPPDKVMRLPEGSWGEHGDHSVWLNDQTRWMWEVEYRAEEQMLRMLNTLPWRANAAVREMLERAGRQLLLLQASDWPFVVHSKGAVDYGIQRFSGHATRFDRFEAIAHDLAGGKSPTPLQKVQIEEADGHDNIFAEIDLNWWAAFMTHEEYNSQRWKKRH